MGVMNTGETLDEKAIVASAEKALSDIAAIRTEVSKVIFGQEKVVQNTLLAILSGGHALLVGVPGLAKTKLVTTLGTVLGLDANRIQFTPDLMPSDILGSEVMDQDENGRRSFRFIKGPVFAQLLMADEINRASPRTQSALLQAMQEYHITMAGQTYEPAEAVPRPGHPEPAGTGRHLSAARSPGSTASCFRWMSVIPNLPRSARSCSIRQAPPLAKHAA